MKKFLSVLLIALTTITAFAKDEDAKTLDAVSMASFEQGWLDNKATIALKNNTTEEIYNVQYIIEYLDMKDNQLDYKEISSAVEIAPGMTRKVNIPAYERNRNYSYYLSESSYSNPHKFKVKFELKSYNQEEIASDSQKADNNNTLKTISSIVFIALIFIVFCAYIGLYVLIAIIANRNHRSVIGWLLLSFIATPLLVLIILLCIGKAD